MILGLDVGEKRIGVAISDEQERTAYPLEALPREKGKGEREILRLIQEKRISTLVVGLPLGEHGQRNEQCSKVEAFAHRLSRRSSVVLIFVDEFGTSEEAKEKLGLFGRKERATRKRGVIDAVSASIVLQMYLEERQRQ